MKSSLTDFANNVRASADIVDIIGGYIPLKRAGASYKGLCPFHKEKTPSFNVHQGRQIFHCFGCGVGGDVIKFIMMQERLDFRAALEHLARRLGIPLPEITTRSEDDGREKKYRALREINNFALKYFRELYESSEGVSAREYLKGRGIDSDLAKRFAIGWAPDRWHDFLDTAVKKGYSQNLLLEAGLILPGNTKGSFYDRFRGRVMFPIIDLHGDCVAFGGRILGDGEPKYLNSPETDIYKKGRVLYGLNLTRGQLRGNEPALLVEGYMDLIALYKYGFNTAVASLGTALTEEQARLLKRFTKEVIFIYDGDEAGQKAMLRGCEVLLAQSLSVKIVVLPESEDPDTFLDKKGAAGFQSLIEKRMDFLDFFIETGRRDFNIRTPEGKIAVLDMLKPILDRIHHPILFNDYTFRIAEGIGLEQRLVIQHIRAKNAGVKKTADEAIQKHAKEKIPPLELFLVRILLDNPELCPKAQETLELELVSSSVLRGFISRYLSEAQESSDFISIEENASEEEASLLREATFISSPLPNASPEELLRINLERLKISHKRRHRRHLVQEVQKAEKTIGVNEDVLRMADDIHQNSLDICELREKLFVGE